jgi:hypothetical protein
MPPHSASTKQYRVELPRPHDAEQLVQLISANTNDNNIKSEQSQMHVVGDTCSIVSQLHNILVHYMYLLMAHLQGYHHIQDQLLCNIEIWSMKITVRNEKLKDASE